MALHKYSLILLLVCSTIQGMTQKTRSAGEVPPSPPPPPPEMMNRELVPISNMAKYPPVITMLPANIKTKLTGYHERIPATRLFIKKDSAYVYNKPYFAKGKSSAFILSDNSRNFEKSIDSISDVINTLEGKKLVHDFTLNEYKGRAFEIIDTITGQSVMTFIAGDKTISIGGMFIYNLRDADTKQEFCTVINSIYYKANYPLDPMEVFSFSFDKSIFDYKFIKPATGGMIFSELPGYDDAKDAFSPNYQLYEFGKMSSAQVTHKLYDIPNTFKAMGYETKINNYESTFINDNLAIITEYACIPANNPGKTYYVYIVAILDKYCTVMLNGYCKTGYESFRKKCMDVMKSVKFPEKR